jgi:hypothetical protein
MRPPIVSPGTVVSTANRHGVHSHPQLSLIPDRQEFTVQPAASDVISQDSET